MAEPRTCQYASDVDPEIECGAPATHTGIVWGASNGEVFVCAAHGKIGAAEEILFDLQTTEAAYPNGLPSPRTEGPADGL